MAGEWPKVPVSDVATPILGGTPSRQVATYWSGNIRWATAKDIAGNQGRFIYTTDESITELGLNHSAAKVLPKGTVVITARGTVGALAQLGSDMAFNQTCYGLASAKELNQNYLFYALKASLREMQSLTYGTVFNTITMKTFDHWLIPLPPFADQRAIAHILGTLDDKIGLNRRMNETLESMARALFKSWFVDFGPVRAKVEGRDPGLPKHLADLFPDRFEDSELGEIPAGWRVGKVGDVFKITMGQSPPGNTYNDIGQGLPFYQGRVDFGFRFPRRRIYCSEPTRLADPGDTLVTVRAPVGDINMAVERCCIGRGVAAARHLSGARSYTYYFMHSLRDIFGNFEAEGTVFGSINKKDFNEIACAVPPDALTDLFEQQCFSLDEQIELTEQQSGTLAALRDTLLPKLVTGEVRLAHPERIVQGTVR